MTIRTHVKDSSTWRAIETIYVKVGTEWKKTKGGWSKEGGVWRLTHIPTVRLTFSQNINDIDVLTWANWGLGYTTVLPVRVIITIPAGVVVGQSITYSGARPNEVQTKNSLAAITIKDLPAGSEVIIYNYGTISGCGGQGGARLTPTNGGVRGTQWAGGDAILCQQSNTHIVNAGTIQGGGGGGAGGDWAGSNSIGGGGGAGSVGGIGGAGYAGNRNYGVTGTLTTGGQGTHNAYNSWGGNAGMPGQYGGNFNSTGQVGQPGAAIVGNSLIYWWQTGTIIGPIIA
jgi:hypothetical protein